MRVFLLNENKINGETYPLSEKERKYINVLRIKDGESFMAKDKKGNLYTAALDEMFLKLIPGCEERGELPEYDGPMAEITLMQCLAKGKKNEKIVREATEAGVERIIFFPSRYSDVKELDEHSKERIDAIAREAVMQSGGKMPEIIYEESLERASTLAKGKKLMLHQGIRSNTIFLYDAIQTGDESVSILVGPEGGLEDGECEYLEKAGFIPILLGTNILRTETAGIYAIAGVETILNRK